MEFIEEPMLKWKESMVTDVGEEELPVIANLVRTHLEADYAWQGQRTRNCLSILGNRWTYQVVFWLWLQRIAR